MEGRGMKSSSERESNDPAMALVRLVEAFDRDEIESFEMNISSGSEDVTQPSDAWEKHRATGAQEWVINLQRRPKTVEF